jgi:hypothetical protein
MPRGEWREPVRKWHQLDMFKTAKELRGLPLLDVVSEKRWREEEDVRPISDKKLDKQIMGQKLKESRRSGLYDSIRASGVTNPIHLQDTEYFASADLGPGYAVSDGHHRIASAHNIDPNMLVPVEYREP